MKITKAIVILSVLTIFITTTYAAEVPRESAPCNATNEAIIVVESFIGDILTEVQDGMGYADARAKSNRIFFNAWLNGQTNGYSYGELVDIANAAIWQYRDMCLRPDFYANNLEKVRTIIAPVIEDYKSGKITYVEAEFNARNKIYQSVKGYLRIMIEKGMLERSTRGVYILPERLDDEFFNLQNRFKKGIFSNGTALYLLGFADRTPSRYDMTFPASYNTSSVKNEVIAHRVKKELYEKGVISVKTPFGNSVNVYCIEHTLCDILQERYCMDIQIVTDAYKRYARYKDKNLKQLMEFSKLARVEGKVKRYMEVLL